MSNEQVIVSSPITVFYSYASIRQDEALRNNLEKHLSLMRQQGLISGWHHRNISAGDEWKREINIHLNLAKIILLLVSPDFIASDYCYGKEMLWALERHNAGEARVIPVILRPVDWESAPFAKLRPLPTDGKAITMWSNRDNALKDVAKGVRQVVEELLRISTLLTKTGFSIPFPQLWMVPYQPNVLFIGRDDLLNRILLDYLNGNKITALTQAQTISRLGGIGKTQIASEYVYRFRDKYNAIFWVNAATRASALSDLAKISVLLSLFQKGTYDPRRVVEEVQRWLIAHEGWLLIFDNVDDLAMIYDFLPTVNKGHLLLTTREHTTGGFANDIEVGALRVEESMLLLLKCARIIASDDTLSEATPETYASAEAIVSLLNGIPLALVLAGAFIEESQCGVSAYLKMLKHQFEGQERVPEDHSKPTNLTYALTIQTLARVSPNAVDLLRFCTFLNSDMIPREIVEAGFTLFNSEQLSATENQFHLDSAIGELLAYGLMRRNIETGMLTLHRLLQMHIKNEMNQETQRQWVERTVNTISQVFPFVEPATWFQCQLLLPYAQACATFIDQYKLISQEAAQLLNRIGAYHDECRQYQEAEPLLKQALMIREEVLGIEHPRTIITRRRYTHLLQKMKREQ